MCWGSFMVMAVMSCPWAVMYSQPATDKKCGLLCSFSIWPSLGTTKLLALCLEHGGVHVH